MNRDKYYSFIEERLNLLALRVKRNSSLNLQNMNTIEFRLFRGTLKLNTFIASLQFVVVITRFVKSVKLNDIFTAKWSDVFCYTEYEELNQYLKERNLTEEEN